MTTTRKKTTRSSKKTQDTPKVQTVQPVKPRRNCGNCEFLETIRDFSFRCYRYPEPRDVSLGHWCGEFKPKEDK